MGKRSEFKRMKNDWYSTPRKAVEPLIAHLPKKEFTYAEPCAGDAILAKHLSQLTRMRAMASLLCDIEPKSNFVLQGDAMTIDIPEVDYIITNPPWTRQILHPMIDRFAGIAPTWLLFDADWMHTKQARPYLDYCRRIVAVGRVKWIPDSKHVGKDNAAWYLFDKNAVGGTFFFGLG
jgi:hypothetical protein